MNDSQLWYVTRRGELLAQEFLLDLGATQLASLQDPVTGIDYVALFTEPDGSAKIVPIEVKATQKEVNGRYSVSAKVLHRLEHLNTPALLVVVDVKRNEIYFNWAREASIPGSGEEAPGKATCSIQLRRATPSERQALKREIADLGSTAASRDEATVQAA